MRQSPAHHSCQTTEAKRVKREISEAAETCVYSSSEQLGNKRAQ
jgi:hypothetical protein